MMPERLSAVRPAMRPDLLRRRALMVAIFLALWMVVIGARLVQLQTSQHARLSARAREQQQDKLATNAHRGLILDREGRELARSIDVDSFFAVPGEIEDVTEVATRLAPLLEVDADKLAARLRAAKEARRGFIWLARKLDAKRSAAIRALKIKGVHPRKETKRRYPHGELAAHVLGFVGLDENGQAGVERFLNTSLEGTEGEVFVEADAGRQAYESVEIKSRAGQPVRLTIDQVIQYRTEQALSAVVARSHAKSATALVLEPRTGEILALANVPTFDPNDVKKIAADQRGQQALINQALENIYEPGSTFKIVAFAAALEEKLIKPGDRIDCQMGSIKVAGRIVKDHQAFGTLTATEALAKSSNVAAIKLGLRVGEQKMYDYIRRFGFGVKTGIELPGETPGLLRRVERWHPSSMGSIAIGQEVGVTPLQMAAAFATLANNGIRVTPHLVREMRHADGSTVRPAPTEERRVVSARTAQAIQLMLESVTLKGTAKAAQINGYTAAGKTGTAQKIDPATRAYSQTKHVASFAGFAPVANPSVVIVVVVDEPSGAYHGGDVAAPVFREIAEYILPYMNVAPDAEIKPEAGLGEHLIAQSSGREEMWEKESAGPARETDETFAPEVSLPQVVRHDVNRHGGSISEIVFADAGERALLMPDVRGWSVRDVARICAKLGLELEARGEGRALKQIPAAGARVEAGEVVRVEFRRSD